MFRAPLWCAAHRATIVEYPTAAAGRRARALERNIPRRRSLCGADVLVFANDCRATDDVQGDHDMQAGRVRPAKPGAEKHSSVSRSSRSRSVSRSSGGRRRPLGQSARTLTRALDQRPRRSACAGPNTCSSSPRRSSSISSQLPAPPGASKACAGAEQPVRQRQRRGLQRERNDAGSLDDQPLPRAELRREDLPLRRWDVLDHAAAVHEVDLSPRTGGPICGVRLHERARVVRSAARCPGPRCRASARRPAGPGAAADVEHAPAAGRRVCEEALVPASPRARSIGGGQTREGSARGG